jgi:uncharacterized membrane protein YgdD (TMEM256/DUF423 family)
MDAQETPVTFSDRATMTKQTARRSVVLGALLACSAVVLGALGAHALAGRFNPQQSAWWATAVQYQMWHALAVLLVAALNVRRTTLIAVLLSAGALIFSGTLYLMALGLPRWLGAITPIGGILMIAGWLLLGCSALRGHGAKPQE